VEENDSLPGTVSILPRSKHLITAVPLARAAAAGMEGIVHSSWGVRLAGFWGLSPGGFGFVESQTVFGDTQHGVASLGVVSQASFRNPHHGYLP
jgi:hypothetical protein